LDNELTDSPKASSGYAAGLGIITQDFDFWFNYTDLTNNESDLSYDASGYSAEMDITFGDKTYNVGNKHFGLSYFYVPLIAGVYDVTLTPGFSYQVNNNINYSFKASAPTFALGLGYRAGEGGIFYGQVVYQFSTSGNYFLHNGQQFAISSVNSGNALQADMTGVLFTAGLGFGFN
jgi:hypothetical protein